MFENYRTFQYTLAGRPLIIETGKISQLSNGSCLVRNGDTVLLANVSVSAAPRDGIDFLPLSVDFEERLYSVGKIPGSFLKREGRPSEKAVLTSRVIDRPIRPLFPKDLRNDVVLSLTVLSVDPDNSPEIAAMTGASIALSISDIPWNGPIGGVFVGLVDGRIVINPTAEQRAKSELDLTVAGTKDKVIMIEAGAKEVDDDTMYEAIMKAHEAIKPLVGFIQSVKEAIGKPKFDYPSCEIDHAMFDKIEEMVGEDVKKALDTDDKKVRDTRLKPIYEKVFEALAEEYPDSVPQINECMYKLQKKIVRHWLKEERRRVDGRRMDQIRSLAAEVSLLPRTHGSAMFTRGQTQVLTVATLAPLREAQLLDGIDAEETKRYMHHYNMPAYSVGEAKSARSPGRREIGHGALAERALEPVIPAQDAFPYAIRLVSEVVSSNGSTSQASVCGSTLALMDAGVPITAPVAGISCGLITDDDGGWATMIDIQGLEDFFGDMDFKVAGTKKGITAIQMDLKIDGLTPEIIKNAFEVTKKGRFDILDGTMLPCIAEPRSDVSEYAPKMISTKIDPEKIREVIGSGGKVIQKICADTGAQIDIEDDGSIFISAVDKKNAYKALDIINAIVMDPEPGAIYTGKVTGIIPIGCFVEYAPGKEGLVHISKLDKKRVEKVEDVVAIGDVIKIMVLGVDNKGRINLSRKDAMDVYE
ncbi:MAG: polyribonucleotide nucleotidyltransferase [Eubacteriales bacterium]|nr:polyribonucleotide nucleotidyltransferase [Eubacteriales bacterium]